MKRIICLFLLGASAAASHAEIVYREELQAPDVDFYITLQGTRTDFSKLGANEQDGLRLRLGVEMKDVTLGRWLLRIEGGLNQFGRSTATSTEFRAAAPGEFLSPVDEVQVDYSRQIRLSGIELGAALFDSELFYIRGGVFINSLKVRDQEIRTPRLINGDIAPEGVNKLSPSEESRSSIQPYLGAGIEIPIVRSLNANAEFNLYRIEGEHLNNFSLGLQFRY